MLEDGAVDRALGLDMTFSVSSETWQALLAPDDGDICGLRVDGDSLFMIDE